MYIKIMDICNMIITLLISLHMTSLHQLMPGTHYTAGLAGAM